MGWKRAGRGADTRGGRGLEAWGQHEEAELPGVSAVRPAAAVEEKERYLGEMYGRMRDFSSRDPNFASYVSCLSWFLRDWWPRLILRWVSGSVER